MCVSSILAGALWGFIPAYFKAKYNTNETLFTLMMNYVATQLVAYFVIVWENPKGPARSASSTSPRRSAGSRRSAATNIF